jgi:Protein of unknown function (DUF3102)
LKHSGTVEAVMSDNLPVPAALSNSLCDLAARIKAEHEACGQALKASVQHAMAAGDLLTEAKAQLQHGQWLPWLKDNCGLSPRMAQNYMRLADHRAEVEAKCETVAHLTIRQALTLLTESAEAVERVEMPAPGASWDEIWEWAEEQVNAPFNEFDLVLDEDGRSLRRNKMLRQLGVPIWAGACLDFLEFDKSALRLCPSEGIERAVKLIAPVARQDTSGLRISSGVSSVAVRVLTIEALRYLGKFLNEIEHRQKLSADEYSADVKETWSRLDTALKEEAIKVSVTESR